MQQGLFSARTRHDIMLRLDAYLHGTLVVLPPNEDSDDEIDESMYSAKETMMAIRRRNKKKKSLSSVELSCSSYI